MPILVKCPTKSCGKILNVPDSAAGRTIRCPACGNPVPVPSSAAGKGGSSVLDLSDTSDAYAVADEPETDYSTIAAPPPAFTGPYVRRAAVSRAAVGGLLASIVAMLALVGGLVLLYGFAHGKERLQDFTDIAGWANLCLLAGLVLGLAAMGISGLGIWNSHRSKGVLGGVVHGAVGAGLGLAVLIASPISMAKIAAERNERLLSVCHGRLEKLGEHLLQFAAAHQGRFPSSLDELKLSDEQLISCPSSRMEYTYISGLRSNDEAGLVLAYCDPETNKHQPHGGNVLLVNGKVKFKSARELRRLVLRTRQYLDER